MDVHINKDAHLEHGGVVTISKTQKELQQL